MPPKRKANEIQLGDVIELDPPNGFVVLPDGTVVSARQRYTVQHVGPHTINGVEYVAAKGDE